MDVPLIALDKLETEEVHELVFFYPDHRASAQSAVFGQGYELVTSEGDSVTFIEGQYLMSYVKRPRLARVPPGYLWVEERRYTREKKPAKPPAKQGVKES